MDQEYNELLNFIDRNNIICPMPSEWGDMYNMLVDRLESDVKKPSLPLILAAWEAPVFDKMIRFQEHLNFALERKLVLQVCDYLYSLDMDQFYIREI